MGRTCFDGGSNDDSEDDENDNQGNNADDWDGRRGGSAGTSAKQFGVHVGRRRRRAARRGKND